MGPDDALRGRGKSSREGRRCQGVWKLQGDFMAMSPACLPLHFRTMPGQGGRRVRKERPGLGRAVRPAPPVLTRAQRP